MSDKRDPSSIYKVVGREGTYKIICRVDTSKHDSRYQQRIAENGGLFRVSAVGPVPGLPVTVYGDDLLRVIA